MLKLTWLLGFSLVALFVWACRPEAERLEPNPGKDVNLSTDSLKFDTVITQLRTPSRRFRIYNPNDKAIRLKQVALTPGSYFDLIVNGQQGRSVGDIDIRGGDSVLVVVQGQVPRLAAANLPYLIEDSVSIAVEGRSRVQWIKIEAKGQNAHFLTDSVLTCGAVWDDTQQPYFLKDNVLVAEGCSLTIKPGVTVLNYRNSSLLVRGVLKVQGTQANPVRFLGTRQEAEYDNSPGQWYAIAILDSSRGSTIEGAIIKNGTYGVQVGTPADKEQQLPANYPKAQVEIYNCQIGNMSGAGIFSFNGEIKAYNNLIYDCAQFGIAGLLGGAYDITHNTVGFTNLIGFARRNPAVAFTETYVVQGQNYPPNPLSLRLYNNIIGGNQDDELALVTANPSVSTDTFEVFGNVLRSKINGIGANNTLVTSPIPFVDLSTRNFNISAQSPAAGAGENLINLYRGSVPFKLQSDLAGKARDFANPDAGAFEAP